MQKPRASASKRLSSKETAIKYISLCSGIEAASCALVPIGMKPVAFAEIEEFPSAVLRRRFPDVPNVGDLTKQDWREYRGAADLVVGGFPCQEYSRAGDRGGVASERGSLMLRFLEACRDIDPRWVIAENVPNLLSIHKGRDFQVFLETVARFWPGGGLLLEASSQRVLRLGPATQPSLHCHRHSDARRCRTGTT